MFLGITNSPRDYAWGSKTAIPELLGRTVTGAPQAELWLGVHPGSPSVIVNPAMVGGADTLKDWIAAEPGPALGSATGSLPFLLKILAAAEPLSLQAHPTPEQAREGFDRENAAGVPIDAPDRNYKDPYAKPELIVALSERFEALSGFRPLADSVTDVTALDGGSGELRPLLDRMDTGLEETVRWLETAEADVIALVASVGRLASAAVESEDVEPSPSIRTAAQLAAMYPEDPGVAVSLLMHRVSLRTGEALFLPAGNIHAYLEGLGVELMAPSDNVLRGGLTAKHVDVPELLRVLDFSAHPLPLLHPDTVSPGVDRFAPSGVGFALVRVTGSGATAPVQQQVATLSGPSIAVCTGGSVTLAGAQSATLLHRGEACFITPDEGDVSVDTDGSAGESTVFFATGSQA